MSSTLLETSHIKCAFCDNDLQIPEDFKETTCPHCSNITEFIAPQPGPQTLFLSLRDVSVVGFGGSAGGGKTFIELVDPIPDVDNSLFRGVVFRRTKPQIRAEGGLWDSSVQIYPKLGARPKENILEWLFESGATIRFSHMEHETDRFDWDSAQVDWFAIDQAEQFTRKQVFYLFSRMRSISGSQPRMRLTFNPPDNEIGEWIKELFAPWIDEQFRSDHPDIAAESGEVRWFVQTDYGIEFVPQGTPDSISISFVRSTVYDNKIMLQGNPNYLAWLKNLPFEDRQRLLDGKFEIIREGGMFRKEWFEIIDWAPADLEAIRIWDMAATEGGGCFTAGAKMAQRDGIFYLLDMVHEQLAPDGTDALQRATALSDTYAVKHYEEREGGSAGPHVLSSKAKTVFLGFDYEELPAIKDKVTRAKPFASAAAPPQGVTFGRVKLLRGDWNQDFLKEVSKFPNGKYKDQVDAVAWGVIILGGSVDAKQFTKSQTKTEAPRRETAVAVAVPQRRRLIGRVNFGR